MDEQPQEKRANRKNMKGASGIIEGAVDCCLCEHCGAPLSKETGKFKETVEDKESKLEGGSQRQEQSDDWLHEPSMLESMMHTYGYTPEAVDTELHKQKSFVEDLERTASASKASRAKSEEFEGIQSSDNVGLQMRMHWIRWRLLAFKISGSFPFQAFFGTLIVINAITMGFEADSSKEMGDVYATLETVFCSFFLIECVIRLAGSPVPPTQDVPLMLDCVIVLISVVDNFILRAAGLTKSSGDDGKLDLSVLTVLRILRIVRVARLFRAMTIFRPIQVLMGTMMNAMANLFWIICLLMVLFYCFGLTFRMMLDDIKESSRVKGVVDEYFSSIGQCIMTGIAVLLRGFNWTDRITTPLINDSETAPTGVVWLIFVCAVHVCVANLIVGVFVEQLLATAQKNDEQVNREKLVSKVVNVHELKRIYAEVGVGKASLSRVEFKSKVRENPQLFESLGLDAHEFEVLLESLDFFGQNRISCDDFIFAVLKMKGGIKTIDMMCFDYQIKQIVRIVQKSPTQIDNLSDQLSKFKESLEHLHEQMGLTKENCADALKGVPERLDALEERMSSFLSKMHIASSASTSGQAAITGSAALPGGMTVQNLRDSFVLADEMRELRRVMDIVTGVANSQPRPEDNPSQIPSQILSPPQHGNAMPSVHV